MIYRIKVEGKEYNEMYTFETPKEGDILDELLGKWKEMGYTFSTLKELLKAEE